MEFTDDIELMSDTITNLDTEFDAINSFMSDNSAEYESWSPEIESEFQPISQIDHISEFNWPSDDLQIWRHLTNFCITNKNLEYCEMFPISKEHIIWGVLLPPPNDSTKVAISVRIEPYMYSIDFGFNQTDPNRGYWICSRENEWYKVDKPSIDYERIGSIGLNATNEFLKINDAIKYKTDSKGKEFSKLSSGKYICNRTIQDIHTALMIKNISSSIIPFDLDFVKLHSTFILDNLESAVDLRKSKILVDSIKKFPKKSSLLVPLLHGVNAKINKHKVTVATGAPIAAITNKKKRNFIFIEDDNDDDDDDGNNEGMDGEDIHNNIKYNHGGEIVEFIAHQSGEVTTSSSNSSSKSSEVLSVGKLEPQQAKPNNDFQRIEKKKEETRKEDDDDDVVIIDLAKVKQQQKQHQQSKSLSAFKTNTKHNNTGTGTGINSLAEIDVVNATTSVKATEVMGKKRKNAIHVTATEEKGDENSSATMHRVGSKYVNKQTEDTENASKYRKSLGDELDIDVEEEKEHSMSVVNFSNNITTSDAGMRTEDFKERKRKEEREYRGSSSTNNSNERKGYMATTGTSSAAMSESGRFSSYQSQAKTVVKSMDNPKSKAIIATAHNALTDKAADVGKQVIARDVKELPSAVSVSAPDRVKEKVKTEYKPTIKRKKDYINDEDEDSANEVVILHPNNSNINWNSSSKSIYSKPKSHTSTHITANSNPKSEVRGPNLNTDIATTHHNNKLFFDAKPLASHKPPLPSSPRITNPFTASQPFNKNDSNSTISSINGNNKPPKTLFIGQNNFKSANFPSASLTTPRNSVPNIDNNISNNISSGNEKAFTDSVRNNSHQSYPQESWKSAWDVQDDNHNKNDTNTNNTSNVDAHRALHINTFVHTHAPPLIAINIATSTAPNLIDTNSPIRDREFDYNINDNSNTSASTVASQHLKSALRKKSMSCEKIPSVIAGLSSPVNNCNSNINNTVTVTTVTVTTTTTTASVVPVDVATASTNTRRKGITWRDSIPVGKSEGGMSELNLCDIIRI